MIFHKYQTIYFHIGKTAGVSIEKAFDGDVTRDINSTDYDSFYGRDRENRLYLQHATPKFIQQKVSHDIFSTYFKFTVVRNPFARMVSVFHYLVDQHTQEYGSFEGFIHNLEKLVKIFEPSSGSHYLPQVNYCMIADAPACNEIIFFERLSSDFEKIRQITGLDSRLQHHNQNVWSNWKEKAVHEFYCQETSDILLNLYRDDFHLFGYSDDPEVLMPIYKSKAPLAPYNKEILL